MEDWRNVFPADADDTRRRLEAFAAALRAFVCTWTVATGEELHQRTAAVFQDVQARQGFERVLAFEIEQCQQDAGPDPLQREMIDFVGRLLLAWAVDW